MTIVIVVSIALMLAVSVAAIVAMAAIARSECRLFRMQRERMERMTDETRR